MEYVGGGVDYNSGPYAVQFDAGMTRVLLTVIINDDIILENNETFSVNINEFSLPKRVTIGDHGQSTVTIGANDRKLCRVVGSNFHGSLMWVVNLICEQEN